MATTTVLAGVITSCEIKHAIVLKKDPYESFFLCFDEPLNHLFVFRLYDFSFGNREIISTYSKLFPRFY